MNKDDWYTDLRQAYIETEKIENDYRKINHYQWPDVKQFIISYLRCTGWQFRLNAGWLVIIDMLFRDCLKLRKMWLDRKSVV